MDQTQIDRAIDACLAARRQDMIRLLADWIRIPGVRGAAQPDAPCGANIRRAGIYAARRIVFHL